MLLNTPCAGIDSNPCIWLKIYSCGAEEIECNTKESYVNDILDIHYQTEETHFVKTYSIVKNCFDPDESAMIYAEAIFARRHPGLINEDYCNCIERCSNVNKSTTSWDKMVQKKFNS